MLGGASRHAFVTKAALPHFLLRGDSVRRLHNHGALPDTGNKVALMLMEAFYICVNGAAWQALSARRSSTVLVKITPPRNAISTKRAGLTFVAAFLLADALHRAEDCLSV